jgi:hypothetical protein
VVLSLLESVPTPVVTEMGVRKGYCGHQAVDCDHGGLEELWTPEVEGEPMHTIFLPGVEQLTERAKVKI